MSAYIIYSQQVPLFGCTAMQRRCRNTTRRSPRLQPGRLYTISETQVLGKQAYMRPKSSHHSQSSLYKRQIVSL